MRLSHVVAKADLADKDTEWKPSQTNFGRAKTISRKWCGAATENSIHLCFGMEMSRAMSLKKHVRNAHQSLARFEWISCGYFELDYDPDHLWPRDLNRSFELVYYNLASYFTHTTKY